MIDVRTTPAPVETVTPIKPSEAIRLGCLIAPEQHFGSWSPYRDTGAACALGAMTLGYGEGLEKSPAIPRTGTRADKFWTDFHRPCPECGIDYDTIGHLNDDHRWSRERIADWLESIGL